MPLPKPSTHESPLPRTDFQARHDHDWQRAEIQTLFELPFAEWLWRAVNGHRDHGGSQSGALASC
ncbi:MAG: hypothetical protein EA417_10885 [Gammaproteobacteria bacterium]|nr:MAG: hypothetical protein EA417_10885 [Gammaproteobacteria bacterium]